MFPNVSARLEYYRGHKCADAPISTRPDYNTPFIFQCNAPTNFGIRTARERQFFNPYQRDMARFCRDAGGTGFFVVQFGDRPPLTYSLCKSRRVRDPCCILMPFNTARHWSFTHVVGETPWARKLDAIVWRGVTTGSSMRKLFVHTLAARHNVRFSGAVQGKKHWIAEPIHLGKQLSRAALLEYKYVLSLPGNDVATNLKWLMAQNSVVVMPTPKVEGWLMEGLLKPYVHFVPLDDPRDVDAVLAWMRTHDTECRAIVRRANEWIRKARVFEPLTRPLLEYARDRTWGLSFSAVSPSTGHFDR